MDAQMNWLEQTWEIKRKIAEQYAGVSPSEQLRDMSERVAEEWRKRGWTLVEKGAAPALRHVAPEQGHSFAKQS